MSITDAVDEPYGVKIACPCCALTTLHAEAANEICPECGWEDDGQGDADADEVRGGPNGARSLTEARTVYREYLAALGAAERGDSIAEGGAGLWWTMAMRQAAVAVPMPEFDFDAEPEWEVEGEAGTGAEAGAETDADAEDQPDADAETEAETEADVEADAEAEPATKDTEA